MKKKLSYIPLIEVARKQQGLSVRELATRARMSDSQLVRVLRGTSKLSREDAFYIGLALGFPPLAMERLALLVVYARAEGQEFREHILQKLARIEELAKAGSSEAFSWSNYILSAISTKKPL